MPFVPELQSWIRVLLTLFGFMKCFCLVGDGGVVVRFSALQINRQPSWFMSRWENHPFYDLFDGKLVLACLACYALKSPSACFSGKAWKGANDCLSIGWLLMAKVPSLESQTSTSASLREMCERGFGF